MSDTLLNNTPVTNESGSAPGWAHAAESVSAPASGPRVYDYANFRVYLAEWLSWKKAVNPSYSGSLFAKKAGLQSHTLLGMVIRDKRNLGSSTIRSFSKALGLRGREEVYFERLVLFNQATSSEDKAFYFEQMQTAWQGAQSSGKEFPLLQLKNHASYLKHWHVVAIREMVGLEGFRPDPDWICRKLKRKIGRREAEEAWALLQKIGMVEVVPAASPEARPTYRILNPAVDFDPGTVDFALRNFHREYLKRAQEAIDGETIDERELSSLTLSVSDEDLVKIKARIKEFRKALNREFTHSSPARHVIAVNSQLLNLTAPEKSQKTSEKSDEKIETQTYPDSQGDLQ